MREDIRDGQSALTNTAIEVLLMAFERLAFIEPGQIVWSKLAVVPFFLNGLTGNSATIDEDASIG